MQGRSRRARVIRRLAAMAAVIPLATLTGIEPSGAVHDEDFELEGNTAVGAEVDWESLFDSAGAEKAPLPAGFTETSFAPDFVDPDKTTYTTGGSKDDLPISGWKCATANNTGSKFDLLNAYATSTRNEAGDLILYFSSEIRSPNGSRNAAFWFLQDEVGCVDAPGTTSFTGTHTDGDILIVAAFTNGGSTVAITVYEWVGNDASGFLNEATPLFEDADANCGSADAGDLACAIVNTTATVNTPWAPAAALQVNTFMEGGINITELLGGEEANERCFAGFLANSRSSHTPDSVLHDYTADSFQSCVPGTDLSMSANQTILAGTSVTFQVTEKNDGNIPLDPPTPGDIESYIESDECETITFVSGDDGNGILDPEEEFVFDCTLTPSATTVVTVTGHGIDNDLNDGFDVTWCDPDEPVPAETVCDQDEIATATVTVLNPSTKLTSRAVVTYTFFETNDGDAPLTNPSVTAAGCTVTSATPNAGDTNTNGVLDPGETWQFTCTKTFNSAADGNSGFASDTVTATGHGTAFGKDFTFNSTDCPGGTATVHCDPQERRGVTISGT
jgi:hypothetical protein